MFEVAVRFVDSKRILVRGVGEIVHGRNEEYAEHHSEGEPPRQRERPHVKDGYEKAKHARQHKGAAERLFDDVFHLSSVSSETAAF